jgi:alpha-glucosidase (family GH31 glycosyl hydrolase)
VKAIPVVESGDTQKAVYLLALPIGGWYRVYANKAGTNEERLTLRAKIEQLASTNSVVAGEIHKKIE